MKFSYHITFGNGSNPYHCFPVEKAELKKSIRKWIHSSPEFMAENRIAVFAGWFDGLKIDNNTEEGWVVYRRDSNGCYRVLREFYNLGNALNHIEKLLEV